MPRQFTEKELQERIQHLARAHARLQRELRAEEESATCCRDKVKQLRREFHKVSRDLSRKKSAAKHRRVARAAATRRRAARGVAPRALVLQVEALPCGVPAGLYHRFVRAIDSILGRPNGYTSPDIPKVK